MNHDHTIIRSGVGVTVFASARPVARIHNASRPMSEAQHEILFIRRMYQLAGNQNVRRRKKLPTLAKQCLAVTALAIVATLIIQLT